MRLGRLRLDGFLLALVGAITAASLHPALGASGGPLHLEQVSAASVSLVFFLHGAALSLDALAAGARRWRLHLLVQAFTYGVFPALGALVLIVGGPRLPGGLAVGFFFLCVVSSTISSSVAMTAVARGNVAGAVFNATLSGVLGVLLSPLYASVVANTAGLAVPLPQAIGAIALKVLLPLALGQLLSKVLAATLRRHRALIGWVDRASIVLIVYVAFCDSFAAGIWQRGSIGSVLVVVLLSIALFATVTAGLLAASRLLGFDHGDEVAAIFCGSQKSVANGLPIARVLFGGSPLLGFIVLPLIIYHQVQLAIGAVIARRYAVAAPVAVPVP